MAGGELYPIDSKIDPPVLVEFVKERPLGCSAPGREIGFVKFWVIALIAEKLRESIAKQFEEVFGVELLEGYGFARGETRAEELAGVAPHITG
jgi:hypothetical protein